MHPVTVLLALLVACSGRQSAATLTCTGELSEQIQTVVNVSWQTPSSGTSSVVFDDGVVDPITSPTTTVTNVKIPLLGMPEDTDVHWTATTELDSGGSGSCSGVTHTGSLPGSVPKVSVTTNADGQDSAPYLMGVSYGGTSTQTQLMVYRRDGTPVWFFGDADGTSGLDFHYAVEGGIWFNEFAGGMGGVDSSLKRVSFTGQVLESHDAPLMHHVFCELPDQTLSYDALDVRSYTNPDDGKTSDWAGDAIVEIDPTTGDGKTVFSVWDALVPTLNRRSGEYSIYPGDVDWTHGNSLTYTPETNRYLLSLAHPDDILNVDRDTAQAVAMYGLDGIPATPAFDYQHDPNWLPSGNLLMFSSGTDGAGAVEYSVTDTALTKVWASPVSTDPIALGEARRLPNGDTFVNQGVGGKLVEYTPDGQVVWEMAGTDGSIFEQFTPVSDLYTGEP